VNWRSYVILIVAVRFYRATRMHSADYAVARCLSVCLSVRLSVCLSVYLSVCLSVLSLNGYIYPQSFFSPSGSRSPTSLVFAHQTGWQYSDGDPPNRSVECKVV